MAIIEPDWLLLSTLLPKCYMPLKYDAYFWNLKEQELYSYKSGTMRKLTSSVTKFVPKYMTNPWSKIGSVGYQIVNHGGKTRLNKDKLIKDGIKYMQANGITL